MIPSICVANVGLNHATQWYVKSAIKYMMFITNTWYEITYATSSYSVRNAKQMIRLILALSVTTDERYICYRYTRKVCLVLYTYLRTYTLAMDDNWCLVYSMLWCTNWSRHSGWFNGMIWGVVIYCNHNYVSHKCSKMQWWKKLLFHKVHIYIIIVWYPGDFCMMCSHV